MLASRACGQVPAARVKSNVRSCNSAATTCHLQSPEVSRPRQALNGLAALILSAQTGTAQASPVSSGLQALVHAQESTGILATDTIPGHSPLVLMGLAWLAIASVVSYREVRDDRTA
ncbi:hypothetical protein ABBQ38_012943 [Trebouxia sp. C0009 RCD-2024]